MNKKINFVWFVTVLCLVSACRESPKSPNAGDTTQQNTLETVSHNKDTNGLPSTDVYTQAALETCSCMHPMIEKAKRLKDLESNNQMTEMKQLALEIAQLQPQIQKCSDEIRQKYRQLNNEIEEKRVLDALTAQCPDMKTLYANLQKVVHN